jgi:hypothetical protein
MLCALTLCGGVSLEAQVSQGGITGTIFDAKGLAVAKASVTATNTDTGVQETRTTNATGNYSITPLQPGTYNVEVVATGFKRVLQENVTVDATSIQRVDEKLAVGGADVTMTITDAPPFLDTTDATIGGTIENQLYSDLPLTMNGGPRDPTSFQYLMPGVQENPAQSQNGGGQANGNSGIYGGTGETNLNQNYVNGVPINTIGQQGNNNVISQSLSVDAVDQFSVQTNGAGASFGGAGSTNYTIKAGGNQFHGTVFETIRNTMFDTWGYLAKAVNSSTGTAVKPGEHQDEYGGSMSGPVFKDKLFFFASYSGYHETKTNALPAYITVPTLAERFGNFTDKYGTAAATLGDAQSGPSKPAFQGILNGVPTYNVIDTGGVGPAGSVGTGQNRISTVTWYLANGCNFPCTNTSSPGWAANSLPLPGNTSTQSNLLAALPVKVDSYNADSRMDYTLNARNKFSLVGLGGNTGYGGAPNYDNFNQLSAPYAAGVFQSQKSASGIFTYTYIISQSMINTLSYGYTRTWGNGFSITANKNFQGTQNPENATAAGIINLPQGQASQNMPKVTFTGGTGPPANWGSDPSTGPKVNNSYVAQDQLQWIKGRHNITFGVLVSWLQANSSSYGGYSSPLNLTFSNTNGDNDAWASYLIGAVDSGSVAEQTVQDYGGRFRPITLSLSDTWRTSSKLTLNLGLRYDYQQPFHEVHNRNSFLNVNQQNPITLNMGVQEYAGYPGQGIFANLGLNSAYQNLICHCRSTVHPYKLNIEPRVSFSYAASASTVFNGGFGIDIANSGGVGGGVQGTGSTASVGSGIGTGSNQAFNTSTNFTAGATGVPSFFLNNTYLSGNANNLPSGPQGTEGTTPTGAYNPLPCVSNNTCSPYLAIPPWVAPGISVNPLNTTAQYNPQILANPTMYGLSPSLLFPNNGVGCALDADSDCMGGSANLNFADPYYGGRGPQFINYNVGIQRMINKKAVLTINYAGSQTHFLPGGSGRGYYNGAISPDYGQELRQYLFEGAGAYSNQVKAVIPSFTVPNFPGGFDGVEATVGAALAAFPQYCRGPHGSPGSGNCGGLTDLFPDTGNSSSNQLQISAIQRPWHNLSGFVNYTRAKEIDDLGSHRSWYGLGPQDGNFPNYVAPNEVDRGPGAASQTNAFNLTWVYLFPIGRGQAFGSTNRYISMIGGGWQLSGIYQYRDGYPIQINATGPNCNATTNEGQVGNTCQPDLTPGFNKSQARINGRWGRGPGSNAQNLGQIQYLNPNAFICPDSPVNNPLVTCGSAQNTGSAVTFKIGNAPRSAPYDLHGPGWWQINLGIRRTFNVRETASLHLTFEFEGDMTNATNSTFFNPLSTGNKVGGWNMGNGSGFGTVSGQNANVLPRDWQFTGRFRF